MKHARAEPPGMVVLTREEGQEIWIGDPARPTSVVSVVRIKGDKVRIGVLADKSIPVHRREVAEKILMERGA